MGMQQSQIADMLDRRKSFGEKVARRLEEAIAKGNLPPLNLDGDATESPKKPTEVVSSSRIEEPTTRLYGHDVTEEAVLFAKEWEKLPPGLRAQVQALVHVMVAEIVRDGRERKPAGSGGPRTSITRSQPRPPSRTHG